MNNYELLYILPAKYAEDELPPVQEKVREQISQAGGNIIFEHSLGKKKLAYPIKKVNQGYYLLIEFHLEPEKILKLNKDLKLTDELLRHLIVRKEARSEKEMEQAVKRLSGTPRPKINNDKAVARGSSVNKVKDASADKKDPTEFKDLDKKLDELVDEDIL